MKWYVFINFYIICNCNLVLCAQCKCYKKSPFFLHSPCVSDLHSAGTHLSGNHYLEPPLRFIKCTLKFCYGISKWQRKSLIAFSNQPEHA